MGRLDFRLVAQEGRARRGTLVTSHGSVETPAFMPVGTHGAVKAVTPAELRACGAEMILSNTYHLFLRPGHETVRELGGLHRFMGWNGPILTDSGGFQVMSMADRVRIDEGGVEFRSHLDGSLERITPEKAMEIQSALGSDVAMVLDVCPELPASREAVELAVERTTRWARRSAESYDGPGVVFPIVQGGTDFALRERSAADLLELDSPGYAIGGVSVGEGAGDVLPVVRHTAALLPEDRPRYLMGMGRPEDIVRAVAAGIDLFDCVMPTRNARNGTLFTSAGRVNIKRSEYRNDPRPLDARCPCETCRTCSRAYLRHLYTTGEVLAARMHTIHNLTHYLRLMQKIRESIEANEFESFRCRFESAAAEESAR